MLTIRRAQIEVLAASRTKTWYIAHIRRHFTKFSSWNAAAVGDFVDTGIRRAERYGIHSPQCVSRYLDVMAAHGADFDSREDCSWWAGAVLRQAGAGMNQERLTRFLVKSALLALRNRGSIVASTRRESAA